MLALFFGICHVGVAGWNSSADSLQQLNLKFETKEQAIKFCERQGITFVVEEPMEKDDFKGKKDYGDNFLSALNKSRIAKHGEAHFAYDETHHESHWVGRRECCFLAHYLARLSVHPN